MEKFHDFMHKLLSSNFGGCFWTYIVERTPALSFCMISSTDSRKNITSDPNADKFAASPTSLISYGLCSLLLGHFRMESPYGSRFTGEH